MASFENVAGAVARDGVLQHVGNPLAEQRALAAGRAVAPRADRAVIEVSGTERLRWLDSITSQQLLGVQPGQSTELLVLDPQGHIEHAAAVLDDGASTWLVTDASGAEPLLAWLTRMRFRTPVELRLADDFAVVGGTAGALGGVNAASPAGEPLVWIDPWPQVAPGGHAYAEVADHPGDDYDWAEALVSLDELQRIVTELPLAGVIAADALRVAAWRPSRADADERALPHELDLLRTAVHLSKGCYRGQETVAKVHNLGHPPRRLVFLHLDGSENVFASPGDPVWAGDKEVGAVTSAALHHELGPIALAVIKRTTPLDADLVVRTADGDIAATPEVVVPPEAGATANVPRITRLSRRR